MVSLNALEIAVEEAAIDSCCDRFGLYHVFEGVACSDAQGDRVGDTPRQLTATYGCPAFKDTCPGIEGVDSFNNYMVRRLSFFGCAATASFAATGSNIVPRITRMMLANSNFRLAKGEG